MKKTTVRVFRSLTIIIILIGVMLPVSLVAQLPDSLPIYSQDVLRSWAMGQVRNGQLYIGAQSMDWGFKDGVFSGRVSGDSGESVLAKLGDIDLYFRLRNPADAVTVTARMEDTQGRALFIGEQKVPAVSFREGGQPFLQMYLQDIPLVSGVQSAEVLVSDDEDQTVKSLRVAVTDGVLYFPSWLAGAHNGILSVRFHTGDVVTYPLSSGTGVQPVNYAGNTSFGVADHYVYKIGAGTHTIHIRSVVARPSLYIEALEDNAKFIFDVAGLVYGPAGQYWESPSGYYIQGVGGVLQDPVGMSSNFTLSKRGMAVRIVFKWPLFGSPGVIYSGPDDGGKG